MENKVDNTMAKEDKQKDKYSPTKHYTEVPYLKFKHNEMNNMVFAHVNAIMR
jgi:hypothetical protein